VSLFANFAHRALLTLDPETAHRLTIAALKLGAPVAPGVRADKRLAVEAGGLTFPNPLGLAAGFDKNAEVADAMLPLGFGFVEVGTVTPRPQSGNRVPRVFRLREDAAVINRLGFNNDGHESCAARLAARGDRPGIVGVNIGANKDSADRIADYEAGVRRFAGLAAYLAINISSPNTPGLRDLQGRESLGELLARVVAARTVTGLAVPLFLKIAPDLDAGELDTIAAEVAANDVDGVIVSNTTLSRTGLRDATHAGEAGGLSGRPLFERSTAVLGRMRRLLGPDRVLIGAGGVDSADTAIEKIRAGADLVQLYTGLIFGGPTLPARMLQEMAAYCGEQGLARISLIRDSGAERWSERV